LREERRLQVDLGADPFSFVVRRVERMVATPAAAELRTKIRALNLIELFELAPGCVAGRAGNIDF